MYSYMEALDLKIFIILGVVQREKSYFEIFTVFANEMVKMHYLETNISHMVLN